MEYGFYAAVSRMKYIERWALMRNSRSENLSEHSMEVAMLAHALCLIGNARYGKKLNADRAAVIGLFHDATEIITGDMPTPIKYHNEEIRSAFGEIEGEAQERLLSKLPDELKESYRELFEQQGEEEVYLRRLVKAADKLSALIKCMEETKSGNGEFAVAGKTTEKAVKEMARELPELGDFLRDFLPAYGKTLDELA
jgi:5'-deoxynucleotidase